VLGYSPLQAALFVLPGSLLAFIGGPLAGWSAPRYGIGQVMAAALLLGGLAVAGLLSVLVGRHGAMKPVGRVGGRASMMRE
jgi:hypothetical protein